MVKPIVKDVMFLGQRSELATEADKQIIVDLQDTLRAHKDGCVGMAANMIGYKKAIIIVSMGLFDMVLVNPVITKKIGAYQVEESCLSLTGKRPATRYKEIEVEYQDVNFKKQKQRFSGYVAQIICHEVDHILGIVI